MSHFTILKVPIGQPALLEQAQKFREILLETLFYYIPTLGSSYCHNCLCDFAVSSNSFKQGFKPALISDFLLTIKPVLVVGNLLAFVLILPASPPLSPESKPILGPLPVHSTPILLLALGSIPVSAIGYIQNELWRLLGI